MKYKIIQAVNYPLIPAKAETYEELRAERLSVFCETDDDFIRACRDAEAIIITGMTPLSRRVIEQLERCRIIAVIGIGHQVDLEAATEKAICIVTVPDYCLDEVSDHAMALLLDCARKITRLANAVREGQWYSVARGTIRQQIWPGMTKLRGKTLGLVGFGNIARRMVPKATGFGMNVIVYTRNPDSQDEKDLNIRFTDLDILVETADFISLHCPLTADTHHLFDQSRIAMMKPTACLINTSRGPLIDEKALYVALKSGAIAAAGLDVLEQENPPDIDNPLLQLPQVSVTAHSAHYSDESTEILKRRPDQAICKLLGGYWPEGLVNPSIKDRYEQKWGRIKQPS